MLMCIHNLVKFWPFILKILRGNEILTSIKAVILLLIAKNDALQSQPRYYQCWCAYKIWLNSDHLFSRYWAETKFWQQSRAVTLLQICKKWCMYNPNLDLSNINVHYKIWSNSDHSFSRYWAETKFWHWIKGRYSVANLWKMMVYKSLSRYYRCWCAYKILLNSDHSFSRYWAET